jgi:hypothetical protein
MVILYHHRPGGLWATAAVVAAGLVRPGSGGCRAPVRYDRSKTNPLVIDLGPSGPTTESRSRPALVCGPYARFALWHQFRHVGIVVGVAREWRAVMARASSWYCAVDARQRARWGTSGSGCAALPSAFTSASLPGRTWSSITVVIVTSPALPSRVPDRWAGISRQLGRQGDRGR